MNIDILCVGKIKEGYLREAISEYSKRLSRYCRLNIIEVQDEKTPETQSETLCGICKKNEGERLKKYIREDAYVVTLEIQGREMTSEELAGAINSAGIKGISRIQFVIGGSLGLAEEITNCADMHLSFSRMTFPHQLMRVILLEQIYRSYRIINNEPYHK
jgi:23S rRNA (pseudouridine1915-N3)-methyltransferase